MLYNQPELLSPAGSFDALTAAVYAGCDAVYLSGQKFGARANAKNFTNDTLPEAIDFAHLNGVKVYYAANTLIKENEMDALLEQVRFLYREGIDALIVQDLGVYHLIHQNFPNLPLHASTQMTVHNLNGALMAEKLGFDRVVLSRELSLKDIKEIRKKTTIELECFIHGALCYSYSGQCLFSSLIGGRSGNRGTCAQPCRLPYDLYSQNKKLNQENERYLLSPKDMQSLDILPELIKSGIHSFKLEGRMKNSNYVGLMTSLYRKYMDLFFENPKNYQIDAQDLKDMHQIYNRGGFSNGYYFMNNGKKMMSLTRPNHQGVKIGKVSQIIDSKNVILALDAKVLQGDCLEISKKNSDPYSFIAQENIMTSEYKMQLDTRGIQVNTEVYKLTDVNLSERIEAIIQNKTKKIPVQMFFKAKIGEQITLTLMHQDETVIVTGSVIEMAKTSVMTHEKITTQLKKTGNDPIEISALELDIDGSIFISIKELNGLRREAIEKLLLKLTSITKREDLLVKYNPSKNVNPINNVKLSVLLRDSDQFKTVIKYDLDNIYLELTNFSMDQIENIVNQCLTLNIGIYIALPRIIRDEHHNDLHQQLEKLKTLPVSGVIIRTLDVFDQVLENFPVTLDYTMNIFNNSTINFWEQKGIEKWGISPELHYKDLSSLSNTNAEMVVYGYLPLMVSTQCLQKSADNTCQKSEEVLHLKDRKNMNFPVYKDCKMCTNTIYNALPVMLLDKYPELNKIGIRQFRIELLHESSNEIDTIMSYGMKMKNKQNLSAAEFESIDVLKAYTRGNFARGIK